MKTERVLYLDCFAGASGDMFVGALLDLGVPLAKLKRGLARCEGMSLRVSSITARTRQSRGITGTKFDVPLGHHDEHDHHHHHHGHGPDHDHHDFAGIKRRIAASGLDAEVKRRAISVFSRIAVAEGKIHGVPPARVHFHEIGAVDSIADIVGACVAIQELSVDRIVASSPLVTGSGFVDCEHGRFPVPAPATLEILRGVELTTGDEKTELLTPTGAALLREFCSEFGPMPSMSVEKIGYGLGTKQLEKTPNVLRAVLGESVAARDERGRDVGEVSVIETNLDDTSPQLLGDAMKRLLSAGALDVFYTPVQMKKNRPAVLLTVLCESAKAEDLASWILTNTTTFGVRTHTAQRRTLAREIVNVKTKLGIVEVKVGRLNGKVVSASPEFESCRKLAAARKVPLKRVMSAALAKAEELYG